MIEKQWQIAQKISPEAEQALAKYPALLRQILFNRGFADQESATHFLAAITPEDHNPYLLKGMEIAVKRIEKAISDREKIVVFGDYDSDGVTASVLLVQCLRSLGAEVSSYIPDRFTEGYGLNIPAIRQLKDEGVALIVSVDCGIRALPEAAETKALGMDLIITDHHTVGPELPEAVAIINCKQPGDEYPNKFLSGVGTAYKLASALLEPSETSDIVSDDLLDLVALGTVADLVPLLGENRELVRKGVEQMRNPHRQGLMSLIGVAGLKPRELSAGDIGFMLGPRINAAGRLGSAKDAFDLLISSDLFESGKLAQDLDNRNRERQRLTIDMTEAAEEMLDASADESFLLVVSDEHFHPGVVGLVASRLADKHYRPAIVGEKGAEFTHASCRSIPEFNVVEALQTCAELFENFGGHAAAAGFTVKNELFDEVAKRLQALAKEQLGDLALHPTLQADAELPLAELKAELLDPLALLEPTGYGNTQPQFVSRGLEVRSSRPVGKEANHLKLSVSDGWVTYDAIAFRQGHWANQLPKSIDLLYRFEVNEFRGKHSLQLNVQDIKASASN
jgi:single-stranded-DNA-specific exonuclease